MFLRYLGGSEVLFTGFVDLYTASQIDLTSPFDSATSVSCLRGMLSNAVVATLRVDLSPFLHAAAAPASGKSQVSLSLSFR